MPSYYDSSKKKPGKAKVVYAEGGRSGGLIPKKESLSGKERPQLEGSEGQTGLNVSRQRGQGIINKNGRSQKTPLLQGYGLCITRLMKLTEEDLDEPLAKG
jgi:hypothetical protein